MKPGFFMRRVLAVGVALFCGGSASQAAAPTVVQDFSTYGFPGFLTSLNQTTKGWMFAPPFVGLKWVELNGVLLSGNTGVDDPATGLALTGTPTNYVVRGFDWLEASQRPARNGLCRGGLSGDRGPFGLKLKATPGHRYLLEVLALGTLPKRSFNVVVDGQTVAQNWTILADRAANRLLRFQVVADADTIALQFTPGSIPGAETTPAITALAFTDTTDGLWQQDPVFGRVLPGLVNVASHGTGSSPDGMRQDGAGKGDQAGIDGDPNTYWDETDHAKLYRYAVTFAQPEKIAALAIMGWAQHDFAPKDFEVLCDGRAVKKVENAQYVKNVFHLPIPETTCATLELRITGYYGGSPAIRELGIFSREPRPFTPKPAAPVSAAPAATPPKDGGPILASWPLNYQGQKLLVYAAGKFKPYVKELYTVTGQNILRDAPYDHLHHHGLMYAIKANGVNFWEEVAGCGFEKPVETSPWVEGKSRDGQPQFVLKQTLHWLAPADADLPDTAPAAILIERRTLTVTVNPARKEVALQWKGEFAVGPKTNQVTLTGANYHGLGMRFPKDLDPLAKHLNAGGPPDLNGRQDVSQHKWGSISFAPPNQPLTMVLFGHPTNARGNAWFFTMRTPFAYLSATQNLDQEPLVYRTGQPFQVNYLVTLYPELTSPEAINTRGQAWETSKP